MANVSAFENVKDQIGCCGIWCGSCVVGNGALREVTKGYAEMIEAYGLEEWGLKDLDYEELAKGLESIQTTPLCPGCLKGGGRDNCEMKACASGKGIDDCGECGEPAECPHNGVLQQMRSGAVAAGLYVKTKSVDKQKLIEQWTVQLKLTWVCSVLFAGDR